jgi:putative hemolysin
MATRPYRKLTPAHRSELSRDAARTGIAFLLVLLAAKAIAQPLAAIPGPGSSLDAAIGAILALILLIALNGLFIAAETAIDLLRASHVKHVKEKEESGNRSAKIQDLIEGRQKYVTACLLASRLSRLGIFITVLAIAPVLAANPEGTVPDYGQIIEWALMLGVPVLFVNLLVGELVPRSYAALHPHRVGIALYGLVRIAAFLLSVPASIIVALANVFTARFGGRAAFGTVHVAEEEIKILAESAEETGEIESEERELIHSVLEFNDRVAREIMTPRTDLDSLPVTSTAQEVINLIQESGHSRIPLYEETDDQIVGIVHAKDLMKGMAENANLDLRKLMRPPFFVPEGKSLHELLREMRASRNQLAIVQDEFGGTAGIVTTEDIVEELVGEIVDEYDEEEVSLQRTGNSWIVSGKLHVDEVNDALGSEFETEEFDTIGGLVFGHFGRQPKSGEKIDIDGYEFTVEETDGRRIVQLKIEHKPPVGLAGNREAS